MSEQDITGNHEAITLREVGEAALRPVQAAIVVNDSILNLDVPIRYGLMAAAYGATGDPIVAAATLGAATFLSETLATYSAAGLLDTHTGARATAKLNSKLTSVIGEVEPGQSLGTTTKVGTAMLLGTPGLLLGETIVDPNRTKQENRSLGLKAAGLMGGYFAAEGLALGTAAEHLGWSKTLALGLVAISGAGVLFKREAGKEARQRTKMAEEYTVYHDGYDDYLRVGVFGEDLDRVLADDRTIMRSTRENNRRTKAPVLAPIDLLEWFNVDLMERTYGEEAENVYVYLHPPITTEKQQKATRAVLDQALAEGKIILTEVYGADDSTPIRQLVSEAQTDAALEVNAFGDEELPAGVNFFNCPIVFEGVDTVTKAETAIETYDRMVREGTIVIDELNGPALVPVIEGEEAEKIWELYKKPFDDLGHNDPTLAGFDKESLMEILANPEALKIINRVDGEMTTLVIFDNNFDRVPWFNAAKYKTNFPEYFETDSFLFFPGIVTDETKRGNDYGQAVLDLAIKIYAARGSNIMLGFECTQISSQYIPEITREVFKASGLAVVHGTDEPAGSLEYYAIRKV